ncbi:MAG: hypothetical protein Q8Q58_02870, partial [Candidatus Rokubacteria bacterium]|nr:hypothetical protein [Candidatus Rokubacteria bacterium]
MTRAMAVFGACLVLFGLLPALGEAQSSQGRRRPAQSAPARQTPGEAKSAPADAPSAKRRGDDTSAPVTVDADRLESMQKEGLVIFTGSVIARQNTA